MYDHDTAFARTVDCLLSIGPLHESDLARCPGSDRLPLYFQF